MNWRVHGSYDRGLKYMMCECAQINEGSVFFVCTILIKLLFGLCSVQLVFFGNKGEFILFCVVKRLRLLFVFYQVAAI